MTLRRALGALSLALLLLKPSDDSVCYGSFTSWHNHYKAGVAVTVEFGRTASAWRRDKATAAVLSVGSRY